MCRQILATEQADLHLPPFLLNRNFFIEAIAPSEVHNAARWMLLSYAKLIRYPSDLLLARQSGLLSSLEIEQEITWPDWVAFASEILEKIRIEEFEGRFWYGDLRLDPLNMIFRFRLGILRGFFLSYDKYGTFSTNFKWVAISFLYISFLYISVIFSAMQVGLAGMELEQNEDTQRDMAIISFWFAVFCMVLVILVLVLLGVMFLGLFVWNYWKTRWDEGKAKELS